MQSFPVLVAILGLISCQSQPDRLSTDMVDRIAIWLDTQAITQNGQVAWPIDVLAENAAYSPNLYSGTTGVLLFYLEHHAARERQASLEMAIRAGETLIASIPDLTELGSGLYTGAAGIGFALHELYRSSGQQKFATAAQDCLNHVLNQATASNDGLTYGATTDVIAGDAGIGLYLLWAARELKRPDALLVAERLGRHLCAQGQRRGEGMAWQMTPGYAREMPGFSHGTAGVAYFLVRLHQATGEDDFLDAAKAGARLIESLSDSRGLVYHNQTRPELFYLGWCHGPAGTSRLFLRLGEITGDRSWQAWVRRAGLSMLDEDLALSRPDGFWNNHGQCCGSAGLADFYMRNADLFGQEQAETIVDRLLNEITESATGGIVGASWTHAEHRSRPDFLSTQTGYAQGAAGIGLFLLHFGAKERGEPRRIMLPDA